MLFIVIVYGIAIEKFTVDSEGTDGVLNLTSWVMIKESFVLSILYSTKDLIVSSWFKFIDVFLSIDCYF